MTKGNAKCRRGLVATLLASLEETKASRCHRCGVRRAAASAAATAAATAAAASPVWRRCKRKRQRWGAAGDGELRLRQRRRQRSAGAPPAANGDRVPRHHTKTYL